MRCICLNQNKWRIFLETSFKFWRLIWTSGSSSFCLISLILDSEQETSLIFSDKISKNHIQIPIHCCFLVLSPLSGKVTLSRVFEGHHQESFLFVDTLIHQLCLEAVFNKDIMKCSITKAWSISVYHFKAFIFTSPISRLYSLLGSILKLNGWWQN